MNIIRELRKRANLQQKELAAEVGVSVATVSDWETQKKDPSGDRLRKLSQIFNVDELVILGALSPSAKIEDQDDDTFMIRERLRRDRDLRTMFDVAMKATPEHIRAATAMLKALEPPEFSE